MRSLIWGLTGLAFGRLTAAQSQSATEVVTVYWMVHSGILPTDDLEEDYGTIVWTGSIVTAAPEATTYNLNLADRFTADNIETEITLVNGPSTHAAWQIHNLSTTYGEWCSIGPADPSASLSGPIYSANPTDLDYDCTIVQRTSRVEGSGEERSTETFVETFVNEFPFQTTSLPFGEGGVTRTFAAVAAEITEGGEMLEPGGVYTDRYGRTITCESGAVATDSYGRTYRTGGCEDDDGRAGETVGASMTGAAASETASETAEGTAAETSGSTGESGVAGRDGVSLVLLGAGLMGAGLFV